MALTPRMSCKATDLQRKNPAFTLRIQDHSSQHNSFDASFDLWASSGAAGFCCLNGVFCSLGAFSSRNSVFCSRRFCSRKGIFCSLQLGVFPSACVGQACQKAFAFGQLYGQHLVKSLNSAAPCRKANSKESANTLCSHCPWHAKAVRAHMPR